MAAVWPYARRTSYANDSLPAIDAVDLVNVQDQVVILSYTPFFFGDGSDGDAVLDGVNTFAWASKSGNTYTLTRDIYLDDGTLSAGVTLIPAGFRIWARGTFTTIATSLITSNAANGSGTSGGLSTYSTGTLGYGAAGGSGGNNGTPGGFPGGGITVSLGGSGGIGGTGDSTGSLVAGGAAGVATPPTAGMGGYRHLFTVQTGHIIGQSGGTGAVKVIMGGAGGGGGHYGNDTISSDGNGGGGGAGGNPIFLAARRLVHGGAISSAGGIGGNATIVTGTGFAAGGGAGGGGGPIFLCYGDKEGAGTISAAGGAGGTGLGGAGNNGPSGAAGVILEFRMVA